MFSPPLNTQVRKLVGTNMTTPKTVRVFRRLYRVIGRNGFIESETGLFHFACNQPPRGAVGA